MIRVWTLDIQSYSTLFIRSSLVLLLDPAQQLVEEEDRQLASFLQSWNFAPKTKRNYQLPNAWMNGVSSTDSCNEAGMGTDYRRMTCMREVYMPSTVLPVRSCIRPGALTPWKRNLHEHVRSLCLPFGGPPCNAHSFYSLICTYVRGTVVSPGQAIDDAGRVQRSISGHTNPAWLLLSFGTPGYS